MKKILFILILFSSGFFAKGQAPKYPIPQSVANADSAIGISNAFQARKGLITGSYADTTAANLHHIRQYPFAFIGTTSDDAIWYRNADATQWIEFSSSSNTTPPSVVTIITDSSISICNVNSCDTFVVNVTAQVINILNDSTIEICTFEGACDTININPTPLIPSDKFVDSVFVHTAPSADTFFYSKGGDTTRWYVLDRNCGLISPGLVTYDSLLQFTVSAAVQISCCDGIRRTYPQTPVTLSDGDATNPRYDAIILDEETGTVIVLEGTPAATPVFPQADSCQFVLTYIAVPATATTLDCTASDLTPYDENTGSPEWAPTATGVTVDFANTTNPYHLVTAADVGTFTNGQSFQFASPTTVDLSSYGYMRFFVRLKSNFSPSTNFTVQLSANSLSFPYFSNVLVSNGQYGFNRTTTGSYQMISIPMSLFTTSGGALTWNVRFILNGTNADGFYVDWLQFGGASGCVTQPPTNNGTVTNFSAGNLSPLFTTSVANPATTPALTFSLTNAAGGTVFGNPTSTSAAPVYTANPVLGRSGTTGTLGFSGSTSGTVTIQPQAAAGTFNFNLPTTAGTSGYLLTSAGGGASAMTWTDPATVGATYTASELITLSGSDFQFGGTATIDRTATLGSNTVLFTANELAGDPAISVTSTSTAAASNLQKGINVDLSGANGTGSQTTYGIYSSNSHSGTQPLNYAIYGLVSNGSSGSAGVAGITTGSHRGVYGSTATGVGLYGEATSTGAGLQATSISGVGGALDVNHSSTNTVRDVLQVRRFTTGTAADGIGGRLSFITENTTTSTESANITSTWTNATNATRQGSLRFFTQNINSSIEQLSLFASYTTLTETTATSFLRVNIPTGEVAGGEILVTVQADDATDYQARTLRFIWSAVNVAGTLTISAIVPEEAVAASTGTLVVTIDTNDAGSGNLDFRATATSSLTQTTLRANYQIQKNFGTGAVTPQ